MKKVPSEKKPLKFDSIIKDKTNLPLWAKLRVAYGMATKDEKKQFSKIANSIIAKARSCGKSCSDSCTSACQSDCQNDCTGSCMDSCQESNTCKTSIEY